MNYTSPKSPHPSSSRGISRRTVTTGLAWSIPAVTVAASAPAFAVSPTGTWSAVVTSLSVAPAVGTVNGQALLPTNTTFNTFGTVRNDGPDAATNLRAQVTFPGSSIPPNEFTVNAPWVIESETENTDLNRWLVTLRYVGTVPSGESVDFTVGTRTRLNVAFAVGQNGPYEALARSYNSNNSIGNSISDYFYVQR